MPAGLATFLLFCLSSLSFTHIRRRIRPRRPLRYLNRRCFSASRRRRATYSQHWLSASLCELNKYRAAWPLYKQGKFGSCVFLGVPPADTDWTTSASFYQTQISPVFDRGRFLTTLSDNEFGQRKPKFGHVLVGKFRPKQAEIIDIRPPSGSLSLVFRFPLFASSISGRGGSVILATVKEPSAETVYSFKWREEEGRRVCCAKKPLSLIDIPRTELLPRLVEVCAVLVAAASRSPPPFLHSLKVSLPVSWET